ncbi:uncharacterized protein DMENIID0001_125750 [Sergentomyia squamirostris]
MKIFLIVLLSAMTVVLGSVHGTWSHYRPGNGKFGVAEIDPYLCTHLVYTFFGIASNGSVKILDPWLDLEDNCGLGNIKKFNALKKINPKLKTLASVGGWNEDSVTFSQVANDPVRRRNFAQSCLKFVQKFGFDGVDMDWEYPAQRGGNPLTDKQAFTLMLKDLSEVLRGKGYLLTAAVASAEFSASQSYEIKDISDHLDFINIMTYDLHGAWETTIGHNSPLYAGSADKTPFQRQLNINAVITYWRNQGAPAEKILLGVPLYGRGFRMINGQSTPGLQHGGPSTAGPYTRDNGVLGFNELCEWRKTQKWIDHFDSEQSVPFVTKGDQWIGYDDETSLKFKVDYALNHNLAGIMIWSIETDDFKDFCGRGTFPLLKRINKQLHGTSETQPMTPSTDSTASTPLPLTSVDPTPTIECVVDGFIRDPHDCSVFYFCENGTSYRFICPAGLWFDTIINICD